ncbi:hypothetical protein [Aeromicrobium alkaliterrae]|uniref:Uncharacterized protein n=1 Tax=Aeromicrobium alkaliterrae TaxID=302168 RepID=A0ABN2JL05_9ACTN
MSTDVVVLVATAVLALAALVAAVVTVRAARSVTRERVRLEARLRDVETAQTAARAKAREATLVPVPFEPDPADAALVVRSGGLPEAPTGQTAETRIVDGRVVVVPTQHDLVATALSRPATRFTVLVHGLAHALRPESRDRISALMRREVNRRRRERQRAARRAARVHVPSASPASTAWVSAPEGER